MNNNDIFKKLRVALQLRDDQIVDILQLVDFRISKGEVGNFFRNADHPKFIECGDQVLRNFLNGLVIHLRGTKEEPKDPAEVIAKNAASVKANPKLTKSPGSAVQKKPAASASKTSKPVGAKTKKTAPVRPVENVKFTIKKKK